MCRCRCHRVCNSDGCLDIVQGAIFCHWFNLWRGVCVFQHYPW
jgi:hypothetical protein